MTKSVVILGTHSISKDLVQQYEDKGISVVEQPLLSIDGIAINDYDELFLLSRKDEDNKVVAMIGQLAEGYDVSLHGGMRLRCHLLVHDSKLLQELQTFDLYDEVRQKMDVYPFSMDEMWVRGVTFDYEPIMLQSTKHVHVVIFGMGNAAELLAIHVARVAHYPNYVKNHLQRTRISLIGIGVEKMCESFIKRYQSLFDNSYYHIVKPSEENFRCGYCGGSGERE